MWCLIWNCSARTGSSRSWRGNTDATESRPGGGGGAGEADAWERRWRRGWREIGCSPWGSGKMQDKCYVLKKKIAITKIINGGSNPLDLYKDWTQKREDKGSCNMLQAIIWNWGCDKRGWLDSRCFRHVSRRINPEVYDFHHKVHKTPMILWQGSCPKYEKKVES